MDLNTQFEPENFLKKKLDELAPPTAAFFCGSWAEANDGKRMDVLSPLYTSPIWTIPRCGPVDVELAAAYAQKAFERGAWSRIPPLERKLRLLALADHIEQQAERFAMLESIETGRPLREAKTLDVAKSIERLRWYAELADKTSGQVASSPNDRLALVTREAVGVIAAIVPWNFPLLMAITKVAPALAAGNVVILKPSELSSLTAMAFAKLAQPVLPPGTLQVITGHGREVGEALSLSANIDALAFTGSTSTGARILGASATSNMKRVSLECGGKSPHIVLNEDVVDERMINEIVWGICYNQGQVCDAGANLILVGQPNQYDTLLDDIAARMAALSIGDPFNDAFDLGSMISPQHLEKVNGFVQRAVIEGATVIAGGSACDVDSAGSFYRPTLLVVKSQRSEIVREEVFGPVLAVLFVDNADEAIKLVNNSRYGLAAAVWGADQRQAMQVAARLRVGVAAINTFELGTIATPFGGFRQSGLGRDRSEHALANYTEIKTSWIKLN